MFKNFSVKGKKKEAKSTVQSEGDRQKGSGKTQSGNTAGSPAQQAQAPKGRGPKNPKPQRTQTGNSSAMNAPGTYTGLQKQKENPLFQFGPILKEFLSSKELVNQKVWIEYDKFLDKEHVTVSFRQILANGVSAGPVRDLSIEEYLSERTNLLKKKDPASSFKDFVTKTLDRIGVDLTAAKPDVEFKSVERFVMKHLSPLEREIIRLSDDEYSRIDSTKIPKMLEPSIRVVTDSYGSVNGRTQFLLSQINSTDPSADREPPNWILAGVQGISKGALLESLKIQPVSKITDEQKKLIDALGAQLFPEDDGIIEQNSRPVQPSKLDAPGTSSGATVGKPNPLL